jgi:plastocyanin
MTGTIRHPRMVTRLAIIFLSGGLFAACSNATAGPNAAAPGLNAAAPGPQLVRAANFSFQPASLSVSVGTAITFRNEDGDAHTFTADSGAFDSGVLNGGQSFSFTFATTGTFAYHCNIHSSMRGTIVVGGASAGAQGQAPAGTQTQAQAPTGAQPSAEAEAESEAEHHGGKHGDD